MKYAQDVRQRVRRSFVSSRRSAAHAILNCCWGGVWMNRGGALVVGAAGNDHLWLCLSIRPIPFSSVQFCLIRFVLLQLLIVPISSFGSIQLNPIQFTSIQLILICLFYLLSFTWSSLIVLFIQFSSVQLNSVQVNSIYINSIQFILFFINSIKSSPVEFNLL